MFQIVFLPQHVKKSLLMYVYDILKYKTTYVFICIYTFWDLRSFKIVEFLVYNSVHIVETIC